MIKLRRYTTKPSMPGNTKSTACELQECLRWGHLWHIPLSKSIRAAQNIGSRIRLGTHNPTLSHQTADLAPVLGQNPSSATPIRIDCPSSGHPVPFFRPPCSILDASPPELAPDTPRLSTTSAWRRFRSKGRRPKHDGGDAEEAGVKQQFGLFPRPPPPSRV